MRLDNTRIAPRAPAAGVENRTSLPASGAGNALPPTGTDPIAPAPKPIVTEPASTRRAQPVAPAPAPETAPALAGLGARAPTSEGRTLIDRAQKALARVGALADPRLLARRQEAEPSTKPVLGVLRGHGDRVTFHPTDPLITPFDVEPNVGVAHDVLVEAKWDASQGAIQFAPATPAPLKTSMVLGIVEHHGGAVFARAVRTKKNAEPDRVALTGVEASTLPPGSIVQLAPDPADKNARTVIEVHAKGGTAAARLFELAIKNGVDPWISDAAMTEAKAYAASPALADDIQNGSLADWRQKPFVTIDGPSSKDLDQAMFLERLPDGGFRVAYALADPSHVVRPGTALFDDAMRRGASYYLPGFSLPMLPRQLSEDAVSLNPDVDRRALVVETELDAAGIVRTTRIVPAAIRSQRKLAFGEVQAFLDDKAAGRPGDFTAEPWAETLTLLEEVGRLRQAEGDARGVARFPRVELNVTVPAGTTGHSFHVAKDATYDVERWNEQLSLLCNAECARILAAPHDGSGPPTLFKVHDAPPDAAWQSLGQMVKALVETRGLEPTQWTARAGESMGPWLARLVKDHGQGENAALVQVISRQAMFLFPAARFDEKPGPHHGVGAAGYTRASSPMREFAGILVHLALKHRIGALKDDVMAAMPDTSALLSVADKSGALQKLLQREANHVAIDGLFGPELLRPVAERTAFPATLVETRPGKAVLLLNDPPVEVRVDLKELARTSGEVLVPSDDGLSLQSDRRTLVLGDAVQARVEERLHDPERWILSLR